MNFLISMHQILSNFFYGRELQRIESISNAPVFSHFSETFLGLTTIRAYNQESRFMEMLFKRMEENNVSFVILNCSNRWLGIALVNFPTTLSNCSKLFAFSIHFVGFYCAVKREKKLFIVENCWFSWQFKLR